MKREDILAVIETAARMPRMYGETPSHLGAYLQGMIAGARRSFNDDVRAAWAARASGPAGTTTDAAVCAVAADVARELAPEQEPRFGPDEGLTADDYVDVVRTTAEVLRERVATDGGDPSLEVIELDLPNYVANLAARVGRLEAEAAAAARRLARTAALEAVAACARREALARAAWLGALPPGSCTSPPSEALLAAEAATREALREAT